MKTGEVRRLPRHSPFTSTRSPVRASTWSPSTTTWPAATPRPWAASTGSWAWRLVSSPRRCPRQRRKATSGHHLRHQQRVRPSTTCATTWRGRSLQLRAAPHHYAIVDEVDSILIDEAAPADHQWSRRAELALVRRVRQDRPRLRRATSTTGRREEATVGITEAGVARSRTGWGSTTSTSRSTLR